MSSASDTAPVIRQYSDLPVEFLDMIKENNSKIESLIKAVTNERWLTPAEAAEYIKVSVRHLVGRLKDEIGYSQKSRAILFDRKDLDAWVLKSYRKGKD